MEWDLQEILKQSPNNLYLQHDQLSVSQMKFFDHNENYFLLLSDDRGIVICLKITELYREILKTKNMIKKKWV